MPWGFERGRAYNRRRDIHDRFGGQRQDGIITPAKERVIFAISDAGGSGYGYHDRLRPDGVFEYYGRGRTGDMKMAAGNLAIARHLEDGEDLLLFKSEKRAIRFEGEMVC